MGSLRHKIGFRLRKGGGRPPAECHIIIDRIKGLEDVTVQVSPYGKVQIFCGPGDQLKRACSFLKDVLVPIDGKLGIELLKINNKIYFGADVGLEI